MDLELLDQLEVKVDVAVNTVHDLRTENELLREEAQELERKVASLTTDLENVGEAREEVSRLRARCGELEKKLAGVRGRIERMVEKMKTLEA